MARTLEQFRWDEAIVLTEALAKADWEVGRAWSAEMGLRFRPPWEEAHPQQRYEYRRAAERVLLRGGGIGCSPLRFGHKRPADQEPEQTGSTEDS